MKLCGKLLSDLLDVGAMNLGLHLLVQDYTSCKAGILNALCFPKKVGPRLWYFFSVKIILFQHNTCLVVSFYP
jgi:hypothetical protein